MTLHVLFFASLREVANTRDLELSLDSPLTARDLANHLEARYSGLRLAGALCAINEHYAHPDEPLAEGDTVAFFPPVSGG